MSINFSAFEIGRRALNAHQVGINTTGQNIANVNTPGYTRRSVHLAESAPNELGGYAVGTGVTVAGVQAFRDRFIESRIQTETGIAGRLNAQRDAFSQIENALQGGETNNVQTTLSGFFGAFRDLESNPNSVPLRSVVAQKGASLANTLQATRGRLDDIRRTTDSQMRSAVDQTNSLSEKIAKLNLQIKGTEALGGKAEDLRDQRGELVNQISELTGARTTDNGDGTLTVTIGEGRAIVSGDSAYKLSVNDTPPHGLGAITLDGEPVTFDEGSIRGFQNAVSDITGQIDALDGLAAKIVERVNALHTSGTDLDGNPAVNFFNDTPPVTAANISINPAITGNPRLVSASPIAQPAQNGTIAGEIANLLTDPNNTVGSRSGSFSTIFGSLLTEAGEQIQAADDGLQIQSAVIAQATAQRESVSGVSLDEEAINLMQYQKAYEAAARFIKIADEMTQTILSLAQ